MGFFQDLFAFIRVPIPAGAGSYRAGGILLKVLCWATFLATVGYAAFMLLMAFLVIIGGALFGQVMDDISRSFGGGDFGDVARGFAVLAAIFLLLATLVFLVIGMAILYLSSRVTKGWAQRDASWGLTGARVLTAITGGLAAIGVVQIMIMAPDTGTPSFFQLATLGVCIAIFVLTFSQGVKGEFARGPIIGAVAATPPPATPAPPQFMQAGGRPMAPLQPAGQRWTCPRCRRLYTVAAAPPMGAICQSCAASG